MKWTEKRVLRYDRLPSIAVDRRRPPSNTLQPPASSLQPTACRGGRRGFTLMELLVVMAIMLLISAILVASYFGMMRAASYTAAENDVYNTLQLARQRACMDGSPVFFMLIDSNSYVLVHGVGALSENVDTTDAIVDKIYDTYVDISKLTSISNNVRIWHMDRKSYADVRRASISDRIIKSDFGNYSRQTCTYEVANLADPDNWRKDDRYGFELYPRQALPKGFFFSTTAALNSFPANEKIIFNADGSISRGEGGKLPAAESGITSIYIYEKIVADAQHTIVIEINHSNGTIKVKEV